MFNITINNEHNLEKLIVNCVFVKRMSGVSGEFLPDVSSAEERSESFVVIQVVHNHREISVHCFVDVRHHYIEVF